VLAGVDAAVVSSAAVVGGGGAPGLELPSWAVSLPESFASALRNGDPSVLGRIERGRLLLDLRCVPSDLDSRIAVAVRRAVECM
jgi:L-seryl-tRNA(Ser) seleniumtransferase